MSIDSAIRAMVNRATEAIELGERRKLTADAARALRDVRDLARYLAAVDPGEVRRALGAPGDWGHDSDLGMALLAAQRGQVTADTGSPPSRGGR